MGVLTTRWKKAESMAETAASEWGAESSVLTTVGVMGVVV